jgi:tRNA pseudouridine32 synthase/23S rRNA pseudouridine746 synthase
MKVVLSVRVEHAALAIDILAAKAPTISKSKLKDAMAKGAVTLKRGKTTKRLRRAQADVLVGDELQLHYDDDILSRPALEAALILDAGQYSVWYKPPGMLSQGNEWSDHLALLRVVEQHFGQKRPVFLVHRLDREASGLVIIAHKQSAAAEFSQLIQQRKIQKTYHVQVKGVLSDALREAGVVNDPLDGKPSETRFQVLQQQLQPARTWLAIDLVTGRKHQIRRHFAAMGYPVMGDPAYGKNNQDPAGLALQAVKLEFKLKNAPAVTVELPLKFHRFIAQ